jgi:ABC-type nitrate/sulfonate/bicarbonate transport system substrate-binding protein
MNSILTNFIVLLSLIFLPACGDSSNSSNKADDISCRLKWQHQAQFAGMYAAQAKGFFEAEGIKCTLYPGGQDFNAVKLVASGSDDFGVWGADQVILARSQGIPVVAVAVIFQESPVCFFSRRDSGIRHPQDFAGKKVAMQYGTNVRTEYIAMMRRTGVDLKSVTEIPSRYDMQRFLDGEIDVWNGYTINEPIVAASKGVPVHIIKPSDYGVDMYADCIITTEKMIREQPDLVRRFLRAAIRGWEYALAHRDEAVKIVLEKDARLQEDHERRMLAESARLILARNVSKKGIGRMDEAVWQGMIDELVLQDLLGPYPVYAKQVFTNEFLPSGRNRANHLSKIVK